jgi:hypothetical protein
MRRLAWLALVVAACSEPGVEVGVSETVTIRARGLYLGPSDMATPDGAMTVADNVVISREGIVETKRGMEVVGTKALTRAFPFKVALVGHGGATLSRSSDSGATWTDYSTALSPPSDAAVRAIEASANLYVTSSAGLVRLDALTGTPEAAGVPEGLDVELALQGAGTALPASNQVAYRIAFGKKDANGRLLLGAPSGRAVISNTAGSTQNVTVSATIPRGLDSSHFFQAYRSAAAVAADDELGLVYEAPVPTAKTASQLARTSNVVTATSTAHGLMAGQTVRVSPGGTVSGGTIVEVGSLGGLQNPCAGTSADAVTWSAQTIPGAAGSGAATAVVWTGSQFVAVGYSGKGWTSPDGVTWTARTLPAGNYTDVAWSGSILAAVGEDVVASSTDGITWTARTYPTSGKWMQAVVWTGSQFVAVTNNSAAATSPDGITWTARTLSGQFYGLAWTGSALAAVGVGGATSSDGITWTARTMPAGTFVGVAWSGGVFAAVGNAIAATSPDGVTWTSRTITGFQNTVAWAGTQFVAGGSATGATSPDGITWTSRTVPSNHYIAGLAASGASFSGGEKTVTGSPTADTFTYAEIGTNGTLVQGQTVEPLSLSFVDSVPDGFIGASLYTNPNQEGILNANARPLISKDVAAYQGSLFQANVTTPAYGTAFYLGGLSNDDTVTINGLAYTAKASESIAAREFKLYTAGTASENIRDTAASLIRVVNRSLSSGVTAQYVSGEDDPPGAVLFTSSDSVSSLAVTFSRTTSWSPAAGLSVSPRTYVNGIVWTKAAQPDHVPKSQWLVPLRLGSDDKAILRILPTRSSLFVLKEDGAWRATGGAGVFDFAPFDPTVRIVAPESAVVLDNTIFALTEAGVVRISDTGTALMSRQPGVCDIEPALQALLAPAVRSTVADYAFGVAYESDHKFILWLPSQAGETKSTQAYVYDLFTRTWTRWTPDAAHGFVNPADDRLYLVDGTSVWQERKTIADSDLADRSYALTISSGGGTTSIVVSDSANIEVGDVVSGNASALVTAKNGTTLTLNQPGPANGAATLYKAIPTAITWAPKFGASPAAWTELQSVRLLWDRVAFDTCAASFATDVTPAEESVTIRASDYGWTWTAQTGQQVEVWPPRDVSVGSRFSISLSHRQAWSPNAVAGLAVSFRSTTWRVGR